jgi:hypothetical protein
MTPSVFPTSMRTTSSAGSVAYPPVDTPLTARRAVADGWGDALPEMFARGDGPVIVGFDDAADTGP